MKRRCELVPGCRLMDVDGAGQVRGHNEPNGPRRKGAEQVAVPVQEDAKVDGHRPRDQVDEDMPPAVRVDADGQLVGEVADCFIRFRAEGQVRSSDRDSRVTRLKCATFSRSVASHRCGGRRGPRRAP